ncbi:hypothetical protein KAM342_44320 [Aeromonas caviae]|uniref:Uncharacterized protein n=1 Tax=Aeromonas caviae TaxID=648 RepID=A0AAV4YU48_AERCA|nr:hypothetical protein KAM341_44210 [Aeromonas caviae]GJA39189.1 hypothetical protein KAM342_44320 [Aeromonas caviae]GJA43697.1 hypothetical protein KAM343_44930 [Aeromonas caviae]
MIEQNLPQGESLLPSYHYRHFKHWTWAQEQSGQGKAGGSGDWFEVEPELIDKSDPDCVWRTKEVIRHHNGKSNQNLITHDPQPASRADMASEGLPRLHAPIQPTCS